MTKVWTLLKVVLFLAGLSFFVWAIGLQANDPDGWLWAPFYGFTALFGCILFLARRLPKRVKTAWISLHLASIFALAIWVLTHTAASYNPGGSQELLHEAGGLVLALIWNLSLTWTLGRQAPQSVSRARA